MEYDLNEWRRVEWVRYRPEHDVERLSRPSYCPVHPSLVQQNNAAKIVIMSIDSTELRGASEVVFRICIQTQGPPFDEELVWTDTER